MKLLLTSAGLSNQSISNKLKSLVNGKIKIAFIPTAANIEDGEKDWLIKDLVNSQTIGEVDIVDISALKKEIWLARLKKANVIFVGGGNTTYLMKQIQKSGLKKELTSLLKTRIYVGISAGSIITNKTLCSEFDYLYPNEKSKKPLGLGYVNFFFSPHLNSKYFPKVKDHFLSKISKKLNKDLYALDDNSALFIDTKTNKIELISEGEWKLYCNN